MFPCLILVTTQNQPYVRVTLHTAVSLSCVVNTYCKCCAPHSAKYLFGLQSKPACRVLALCFYCDLSQPCLAVTVSWGPEIENRLLFFVFLCVVV